MILLISFIFIKSLLAMHPACIQDDPVFPCPPSLEQNIKFWIKIYTEISKDRGILHNRDTFQEYMLLDLTNLTEREKSKLIKNKRKEIAEQMGVDVDLIRFQLGQLENYNAGLERSFMYLPYIKQIFKECGVPEDLCYLPHVESSFNYQAYSKMGAAGIWQFTRGTGKLFMKIDYAIDERKDPIKATRAAAKLLRTNYETLYSWPLAITSYNHGLAGMKRAVKKINTTELDKILSQYKSRIFGFASKNFYAEFLAARHIAKNYKNYFPKALPQPEFKYASINTPFYINVKDLLKVSNLSAEEFSNYNLALRKPILTGLRLIPKGYEIRVAPEKIDLIKNALASLPENARYEKQKQPQWYRVKPKDSIASIARKYGVDKDELIAMNDISGRRKRIRPGQLLEIPIEVMGRSIALNSPQPEKDKKEEKIEIKTDETTKVSKEATLVAMNTPVQPAQTVQPAKVVEVKAEVKAEVKPEAKPETKVDAKVVEKVEAEEQAETKENYTIETVYGPPIPTRLVGISQDITENDEKLLVMNVKQDDENKTYGYITIQPDETLSHIADWLLASPATIKRWNNTRRKSIYINQKIKLYFNRVSHEDFEAKRIEYHKGLYQDFYDNYFVKGIENHKLKQNESLWELSQEIYQIPLWLLYVYNPQLSYESLKPGDEIKIPVVEKKEI